MPKYNVFVDFRNIEEDGWLESQEVVAQALREADLKDADFTVYDSEETSEGCGC